MNNIYLNFICNFKPNWSLKKNYNKKKIYCKNFIIFILFLKFFKNIKVSLFIKPNYRKNFSIPKAPHRFKLSKHLIYFQRYNILLKINCNNNILNYNSLNVLSTYSNLLKIFRKIDTSICYQQYIKISFNFNSKKLLLK